MARIRTIKPEFWASEKVGRLSHEARLVFLLCISLADDVGLGRGSSTFLRSTGFPYDTKRQTKGLEAALKELDRAGLVKFYDGPDKCRYYWVPGFCEHQRIDKPRPSKLPKPPGFQERSKTPPRAVREGSKEEWIKDQGRDQGREGKGKEPESPAPPASNSDPIRGVLGHLAYFKSPGLSSKRAAIEDLVRQGVQMDAIIAKAKTTEAQGMDFYGFVNWCRSDGRGGQAARQVERIPKIDLPDPNPPKRHG